MHRKEMAFEIDKFERMFHWNHRSLVEKYIRPVVEFRVQLLVKSN